MAFEDTFLVSQKLVLVADADITTLTDWFRRVLDSSLPKGYLEYLTMLGDGTYCDEVWVYPPNRIMSQTKEARGRWPGPHRMVLGRSAHVPNPALPIFRTV